MSHCYHHLSFHTECAACHHVRAYGTDNNSKEDGVASINFLNSYAASLASYDPPAASYDPPAASYDPPSFGGDSGGGGASTEF